MNDIKGNQPVHFLSENAHIWNLQGTVQEITLRGGPEDNLKFIHTIELILPLQILVFQIHMDANVDAMAHKYCLVFYFKILSSQCI